ncbi:O-methyltransferase protein [Rutstroemia sp. NJR-2017a BBW]|nr:O-methyltransferase protein [Rutstroemia sp. NJR-2017a BBW]
MPSDLGIQISQNYLETQQLPEPSYDLGDGLDLSHSIPSNVAAAKDAALESTIELHRLLLGPLGLLLSAPGDYIYKHNLATLVPESTGTTFEIIAKERGLDINDVQRFLRVAISYHIFSEPQIGYVVHSAASRLLVDNFMLEAWIMNIAEEFWPSLSRTVDATIKWPGSEEPNESGYSIAYHTDENPFDVIKKDPMRQQQFIDAMSYSHLHSSYSMKHLIDNFDFGSIGTGTIVDVGGSHAQVSIAIAQRFPEVKCIVQDLPDTIAGLDSKLPEDVKGRALVPALKKGARVVINDICIPQPGQLGIASDRALRLMDISMKAFNNARERDPQIWASLFSRADPRFQLTGITVPPEARMAIIVAEWTGE